MVWPESPWLTIFPFPLVIRREPHHPSVGVSEVGEVTTTVLSLMTEGVGACFTLLKAKHGSKPRGLLLLAGFQHTPVPSFLDFLHSGMRVKLSVAIDFTSSNGSIQDPNSLHVSLGLWSL